MQVSDKLDNPQTILVELKHRSDISQTIDVAITDIDVVKRSAQALQNAMDTIKNMAGSIVYSVSSLPVSERPHEIEVEFGLKLTTDAKALIVNAGVESHFVVKLKWIRVTSNKDS